MEETYDEHALRTTRPADLPCICDADTHRGGYKLGCARHMAIELQRGAHKAPKITTETVTYYRGQVLVSRPVLQNGEVWSEQEYVTCSHNHETPEAAERCSKSLAARQH